MIELANPFTTTSKVTAITMCPSGTTCGQPGVGLIVSGYGETQSDVSSSTTTSLRYASLLSVSQTLCAAKFATNFGCSNCLPATDVCAQSDTSSNPAKDSCFGDSGGPLVQNFGTQVAPSWMLYGVVSSGTVPAGQNPSCGVPGEYA